MQYDFLKSILSKEKIEKERNLQKEKSELRKMGNEKCNPRHFLLIHISLLLSYASSFC